MLIHPYTCRKCYLIKRSQQCEWRRGFATYQVMLLISCLIYSFRHSTRNKSKSWCTYHKHCIDPLYADLEIFTMCAGRRSHWAHFYLVCYHPYLYLSVFIALAKCQTCLYPCKRHLVVPDSQMLAAGPFGWGVVADSVMCTCKGACQDTWHSRAGAKGLHWSVQVEIAYGVLNCGVAWAHHVAVSQKIPVAKIIWNRILGTWVGNCLGASVWYKGLFCNSTRVLHTSVQFYTIHWWGSSKIPEAYRNTNVLSLLRVALRDPVSP